MYTFVLALGKDDSYLNHNVYMSEVKLLENYSPGILLMQISYSVLCWVNQENHNKNKLIMIKLS